MPDGTLAAPPGLKSRITHFTISDFTSPKIFFKEIYTN